MSEDSIIIHYEATVVTGLEPIAADECKEKLNDAVVRADHGRVFVDAGRGVTITDVLKLRSVDNVYVIIYNAKYDNHPKDESEFTDRLNDIMKKCEWKIGVNVWISAFGYDKCDSDTIVSHDTSDLKPSFRVTANRTGKNHYFTSPEASKIFGGIINDVLHWPVTMKNFDIEVVLNIKDLHYYVCISLTRESLHKRNLISFGPTTLRATIAYNMLRLGSIATGDIVCDAMCGSGAIPIECQINWPNCFTFAGDSHTLAVERTQVNCQEKPFRLDIMRLNITALPFKDNSIDVTFLDLPFGKRLGSKRDNKTLYPLLIKELARCTTVKTGRAVLLSQDKNNLINCLKYNDMKKYWKIKRIVFVKIAALNASMYCIKRTNVEFTR